MCSALDFSLRFSGWMFWALIFGGRVGEFQSLNFNTQIYFSILRNFQNSLGEKRFKFYCCYAFGVSSVIILAILIYHFSISVNLQFLQYFMTMYMVMAILDLIFLTLAAVQLFQISKLPDKPDHFQFDMETSRYWLSIIVEIAKNREHFQILELFGIMLNHDNNMARTNLFMVYFRWITLLADYYRCDEMFLSRISFCHIYPQKKHSNSSDWTVWSS